MADMMKMMGKNKGMMGKMASMMGLPGGGMMGGGAPSEAELAKMQAELAALDPKALESLPPELRDTLKNMPSPGASGPAPKLPAGFKLPGLGGGALPGLGGGRFPGLPGLPGKKK